MCTVYINISTCYIHIKCKYIPVLTTYVSLFLAGNSTPTMPHKYCKHKSSGFSMGSCDTAAADGRCGSNVYEVNLWLWQFGCGKPCLGVCHVRRLQTGRMLLCKSGTSAELILAGVARLIRPNFKWSVVMIKVHAGMRTVQILFVRAYTSIYTAHAYYIRVS